ncbi:hypothetical protein I7I53_06938 [Histoplasma capsulatum var. duboisii H88]|uniref:Uncharacterized protein n=1 Tax=Ajellomyces capsulatus (strain H88) TaxID=544711 RepID=A0A8A1LAY8_AJEC8|nr:hypothetical protein I7I53_06938 [Histoplasma capsulatum var. duboisii H88]
MYIYSGYFISYPYRRPCFFLFDFLSLCTSNNKTELQTSYMFRCWLKEEEKKNFSQNLKEKKPERKKK